MAREERLCKECSREVEDVCHWLLHFPAWDIARRPLVEEVSLCHGFQGQGLEKQTAFVLSMACTKYSTILVQCGMSDLARDVWCTLIMILIDIDVYNHII